MIKIYNFNIFYEIIKILLIIIPLLICVAYLTYIERKIIAWLHLRVGPNRVGFKGLLQPIADTLKLIFKEIIIPKKSNKILFHIAPIITIMPTLTAWAIIPFGPKLIFTNLNTGLLFIIAITSIEVYGIIFAGWSSNSKYAFLGAMRAAAQMISYEITMSFSLIIVILLTKSVKLIKIVNFQNNGFFAKKLGLNFLSWNCFLIFPIFIIYFISGIAKTNRHPFDVVEGESEIVAGYMVEYSGMLFAIFFLSEYTNIILISILTTLIFLGGWIAPIKILNFIPNFFWLGIKTFFLIFIFIWIRGTLPRYRYDQIMKLNWKFFLPITFICFIIIATILQINIFKK
ncbi:NADH-quinone oxidoreductase subunit NuoH [Candidatus Zinderia endosymbiont of Aphrophora alni]|uniref:NADH-quinone oxidoreductase subunit NuoH n=1 Tax=Candidatus Zinderia endosymbiont of Aphrophora alni TaxID=3077951 RepID=UPI0030CAA253